MWYEVLDESLVVCGDAFSGEVCELVDTAFGDGECGAAFPLVICDPPYGDIVKETWDVADYMKWFAHCVEVAATNATIAMWGGVGKHGNRPFVEFAATMERSNPNWTIKNWITWSKRRAYGVADNYLFTREECLIITSGKPTFNIPLLDQKRGYAGYNKDYPAKSEYLRRTNVWTDVTELFKGKIHPCQKPDALYEILIRTHTNEGDAVYDPCAGSLTTLRAAQKLGRNACVVELSEVYVKEALAKGTGT